MAAPRKHSDALRQTVHECINGQGLSGAETAAIINTKHADELEQPMSESSCRQLAKDEKRKRGDVEKLPRDQAFDILSRRYLKLLDRRLSHYERENDADAQELYTFARALRETQPLVAQQGQADSETAKRNGTLHALGGNENTPTAATILGPALARSVRAQRSSAS